jgi:hypothetical protein
MYKVTAKHCLTEEQGIARVYFMNEIPFTYDKVYGIIDEESEIFQEAMKNPTVSVELIAKKSAYLIEEDMHPLLSNIVLHPESVLPDTI